jgi:hypothetical protein
MSCPCPGFTFDSMWYELTVGFSLDKGKDCLSDRFPGVAEPELAIIDGRALLGWSFFNLDKAIAAFRSLEEMSVKDLLYLELHSCKFEGMALEEDPQ